MAETKKTTTAKKPAVKKEVASKTTTKKTVAPKATTTKAAPKSSTTSKTATTKKTVAPKATTATKTTTTKKVTTPKVAPLATTKLNFDSSVLPKELFASEKIYTQAVFDTIMSERASRRQGTHDVKNRSEVSGGGKKPWKQKGTGRARAGSTRSPIWVGGGHVFGPTPERNYNLKVNKKVRFAAFVSALTQLANNHAVVVDNFAMKEISTKQAVAKLTELNIANLKHILVVNDDVTVFKSLQNVPNVIVVKPASVLVEQLVLADVLVLSEDALKVFAGRVK